MSIDDKNAIMNKAIKANPDISIGEYDRICRLVDFMSSRMKDIFWENYEKNGRD